MQHSTFTRQNNLLNGSAHSLDRARMPRAVKVRMSHHAMVTINGLLNESWPNYLDGWLDPVRDKFCLHLVYKSLLLYDFAALIN